MARHKVHFNLPSRPLSREDIIFTVRQAGDEHGELQKFGELRVSKGALVWFPRNKKIGYSLSWTRLDELCQTYGRRRVTRK